MVDHITARDVSRDIETRMGLVPIDELLAERDALVERVKELRAKHGPYGTFESLRKIELASIAQSIRAKAVGAEKKLTEAAIDDAAHADSRYIAFIAQATSERAEWAVLENRIQGIDDTINRGQAIARYLSAEVTLAR